MSKLLYRALSLFLIFKSSVFSSCSQAGSLDLSFGTGGKVVTPFTGEGFTSTIQADGKILVAGTIENATNFDIGLVRLNPDGSLDNTFDSDGKVITAVGSMDEFGYSVAVQTDGKILVAGYSYTGPSYDFTVIRYNANGSIDSTFDMDGIVKTTINLADYGLALVIQPDGKILVAGASQNALNEDVILIRYNVDGSLDNTFDTDGIVVTDIALSNEGGRGMCLQTDGKIVVVGTFDNGSDFDFLALRYNANGTLDSSFSADGIVNTDIGGFNQSGESLDIQADGKIVLGGFSNSDFASVRYNTDGSLDTTFDNDGIITIDIAGFIDEARSVKVLTNGKIIVGGLSDLSFERNFALICLNSDGSLDTSFDSDGIVTTDFSNGQDQGWSLSIQADGKIILAGETWGASSIVYFALARYNIDMIGISENNLSEVFSIFPNPATEQINILCNPELTNGLLRVTNLSGQTILRQNNLNGSNFVLDVLGFANGIYFFELNDNDIVSRKKFIKQ